MVCDICFAEQERLYDETGGSCGQVVCHHLEEVSMDNAFPALNEFKDTQKDAIKFSDLPTQIVYQIKQIKNVDTKSGIGMILELADEQGRFTSVWASSLIQKELKNVVIANDCRWFLVSKGEKLAKNSKNRYFDYKIKSIDKKK